MERKKRSEEWDRKETTWMPHNTNIQCAQQMVNADLYILNAKETTPKKKTRNILSLDFILFGFRGTSVSYILSTCHSLFVFSVQPLFHSLSSTRSMRKVLCAYFAIHFFLSFIFQIVRESTIARWCIIILFAQTTNVNWLNRITDFSLGKLILSYPPPIGMLLLVWRLWSASQHTQSF